MRMLCWGGPKHGEILSVADGLDHALVAVPPRRPLPAMSEVEPPPPIATVSYSVGTIRMSGGVYGVWRVLIYDDRRDQLERNLVATANFLLALIDRSLWDRAEAEALAERLNATT